MDGHVGDEEKVTVHIDKPRLDGIPHFDQHPAGHGKGAVQPGGTEHPAIALGIDAGIGLGAFQLGIFLDVKGGRVAVAGGDHKAGKVRFGNAEGQERGAVTGHIVFTAHLQLPGVGFAEAGVTCLFQLLTDVFHGMELAGAVVQKCEKVFHVNAPFQRFFPF